jgi:hypothetical protein
MKYISFIIFILIILSGCAKSPQEQRMVQLLVEGAGTYSITYGSSCHLTLDAVDKWTTTFWANPQDTVLLNVRTSKCPATLYMTLEVEEGLLFCKSLYIEPESVGSLNCIVKP